MPIGDTNLNIFIFETGYKKVTDVGFEQLETTHTTGVHPLLVAPRMIRVDDNSRSPLLQTTGGSVLTISGRQLRTIQMEGTFGIDVRGLLLYLGNGEIRFQRFYKEVVRFSDAIFDGDIAAAEDILNGTPGITALYALFSEKDSYPFINYYDFWNDISFQARIKAFSFHREHRNGGAQGLIHYRMTIEEVGPLVTGSLATTIINGLLQGLSAWNSVNNVIASYTLGNIIESFVNVAAPFVSEFNDTVEAFQAQADSLNSLMGGSTSLGNPPSNTSTSSSTGTTSGVAGTSAASSAKSRTASNSSTGVSDLATLEAQEAIANAFSDAEDLASRCAELADLLEEDLDRLDSETGNIAWADQIGEGGSEQLDRYDEIIAALDLEDAVRLQLVMGVFFGMSREAYRAYIEAGGAANQAAPEIGGSIEHVVTETDTAASLESTYNVSWGRILAVNRLTPDEALFAGSVIQIPRLRPRGPQGIEGLPTFGSHVGQEAWGYDLQAEMLADSNGELVVVASDSIMKQGAEWLIDLFGETLLQTIDQVPVQVRESYLRKQLTELFLTDQRVASVQSIDIAIGEVTADVRVTVEAINGGTIRTGG